MKPFDPDEFRRTGGARMLELVTLYRQIAGRRLTYLDSGVFSIDVKLDSGERYNVLNVSNKDDGLIHLSFDYGSDSCVANANATLDLVIAMTMYHINIMRDAYLRERNMAINRCVANELANHIEGVGNPLYYARRRSKFVREREQGTQNLNHAEERIWNKLAHFRENYMWNIRRIMGAAKPKREDSFLGDSGLYQDIYRAFERTRDQRKIESNVYNTDVLLLASAVYAAARSKEEIAIITGDFHHFSRFLNAVLFRPGRWGIRSGQVKLYYISPLVHEDGSFNLNEVRYDAQDGKIAKMQDMMSPSVPKVQPLVLDGSLHGLMG